MIGETQTLEKDNIVSFLHLSMLFRGRYKIFATQKMEPFNNSNSFHLVIISCSTCCLVRSVKVTWVCASFDSNLVIEAASTAADDD